MADCLLDNITSKFIMAHLHDIVHNQLGQDLLVPVSALLCQMLNEIVSELAKTEFVEFWF